MPQRIQDSFSLFRRAFLNYRIFFFGFTVTFSKFKATLSFYLCDIECRNFEAELLQYVISDLCVGSLALGNGQIQLIHIYFNFDMFIDIKFGQKNASLHMARLLQIDVKCVAKFAFVRGNLSKRVFAVKHTDFCPCTFSETGQRPCFYL